MWMVGPGRDPASEGFVGAGDDGGRRRDARGVGWGLLPGALRILSMSKRVVGGWRGGFVGWESCGVKTPVAFWRWRLGLEWREEFEWWGRGPRSRFPPSADALFGRSSTARYAP